MDRPRIDELLPQAGNSRYSLTIIAAKRARQINNYYNSLGEGTVRRVPAAARHLAQQEPADDRLRRDRRGQDRLLEQGLRARPGGMAPTSRPTRRSATCSSASAAASPSTRPSSSCACSPKRASPRPWSPPRPRKRFVMPLTFAAVARAGVLDDESSWQPSGGWFEHIDAARRADVMVVAPATANTVAKLATGLADNLLSAIYLAFRGPVIVAPTANWAMYEHEATQRNLAILAERGVEVLPTGTGDLACGEEGAGRMASPEVIMAAVRRAFAGLAAGPLAGRKVVVTAGGTREAHRRGALHRQPLERQDGPRGGRRGLPARRRRRPGHDARRRRDGLPARRRRERRRDGRRRGAASRPTPTCSSWRRRSPTTGRRRSSEGKLDAGRRARARPAAGAHGRHPGARPARPGLCASASPPRPVRASTGRAPRRPPRASTCWSSTTSSRPASASAPTRTRSPS